MSVDELIRERLEALVEPIDEQAVLARIDQLAAGHQPAARQRSRGRVVLGAAAAVAIVAAGVGVAQMGDGPGRAEVLAGPETTASTGSDVAPAPTASVEAKGEGLLVPIEVTTSPLVATDSDDVHALAEHVLTLTNTGDEPIQLGDVRTAAAVAATPTVGPSLFVGTEGCGYRYGSGVPVLGSCNRNFDPLGELGPGDSVDLPIYLWSGIAGMRPLDDGERVFRISLTPLVEPGQRGGVVLGEVVVSYRNLTMLES